MKERKLVQWVLAYLAGAFVALEALGIVEGPWGFSARLMRALHISIVVGFFLVVVFSWYHGERGRQRVSGTELLIVALLLLISGTVIRVLWSRGDDGPSSRGPATSVQNGSSLPLIGGSNPAASVTALSISAPPDGSFLFPENDGFSLSADGRKVVFQSPTGDGSWECQWPWKIAQIGPLNNAHTTEVTSLRTS
jgi:hypothetical protein